ncbi:hypothetical protein T08_6561 [Trichinella sp. T8]|nr:hypothetical protein T08_6561 [Trichinella sp. T8]
MTLTTVLPLETNRLPHKANCLIVNSIVLNQQLTREIVKSNSRLRQLRAAALIAGCTLAFFTIQAVAKLPSVSKLRSRCLHTLSLENFFGAVLQVS